jgi:predicted pyridoxine 5'-phosphate oxidase superfamily flavin-nucleotide-binding protein
MQGWPFHLGELEAQARAGGGVRGGAIRPTMPDQHRAFFEALPFVVVAAHPLSIDGGWPVATIWTGAPGFVRSRCRPIRRTLRRARSWPAARSACSASSSRPGGATARTA